MKKVKDYYELTAIADDDIDQIFKSTYGEFGMEQAIKYTSEFHEVCNHLLWNPTLGRHRIEIRENLYSLSKDAHTIFYTILDNKIKIMRILHGSLDLPKYFQ